MVSPRQPAADRKPPVDFDERLWPVNLALLVLAGFIAGVIAAKSDFQAPPGPYNGYVHLGALAAIVGVLLWGVARFGARVQRRLQLGVFVSLLVHFWLCMLSYNVYLSLAVRDEPDAAEQFEEPQIVTLPDYHWQNQQDVLVDQAIEAPVETQLPDAETHALEQARPEPTPLARPSETEPAAPRREPNPAELKRAEQAPPHRSEQLAGERISRSETPSRLPAEQVETPEISASPQPTPAIEDRVEALPRRAARAEPSRPSTVAPSEEVRPQAAAARRLPPAAQPELDRIGAAARSRSTPEASAASTIEAPAPANLTPANPASDPAPLSPAAGDLARTESAQAAMPLRPQALPQPAAEPRQPPGAAAFAPNRAANREPAAQAGQNRAAPSLARSRSAAAAPGSDAIAFDEPAHSSQPNQSPAQPAATGMVKASGGASGLAQRRNFDREPPGAGQLARTPAAAARRAASSQQSEPGADASPNEPARIPKARAGADSPSAALAAEEVAAADAPGSRQPQPLEASSSAAVERSAADAPRGRTTAAAGSAPLDLAAPKIVSTIGEGRASGGGEPTLGDARNPARIARSSAPADAAGDPQAAELPPSMPGAGRSSAAGTSGERAGPSEPSLAERPPGGVSRQTASLPTASPGASSPAGSLASPPDRQSASGDLDAAGGPAAPRRSDRSADAAASLGGASGGVMPRGMTGDAAPAAADAAIDVAAIDVAEIDVAEIASPSDGPAEAGMPLTKRQDAASTAAGRRASSGLPVRIAAPAGPGGLAARPSVDVGVPSRRARPESELVHTAPGRIILERSGGKQSADVRVRDTAVPGLRQRDRATRRELARQRGGSESSERAVEMGLDFLARHQNPDGSWSLHDFSQGQRGYENAGFGRMQSDTAATGLSMLAFLGAGYTHTDGKYRLVVGRGLGYLVGNQRADGDLFVPQDGRSNQNVWLYSHGIAAIALGEAYGMTRDPALRDPAQRALDFIVAAQNPAEGGWRYSPRIGSDTSVSGWQLMALKSGELAGLRAAAETYRRVEAWLDGAQARENPALYAYRPKAKQDHQRLASRVMTAEGLLMRQYLGWKRDNPNMLGGADYLLGQLPQWEGAQQRDAYYWYYATQVMFQMGGEHWQAWNDHLREMLVERQTPSGPLAGSWDPLGRWPDRWGREAGRLYTTAMHLLMLEVYYRHLPLYRNLESEAAE